MCVRVVSHDLVACGTEPPRHMAAHPTYADKSDCLVRHFRPFERSSDLPVCKDLSATFDASLTWCREALNAPSGSRRLIARNTARISRRLTAPRCGDDSDTRRSCVIRAFMVRNIEGRMLLPEPANNTS